MGYSIELYFDNRFEEKIRLLWDQLDRAGVPSLLPGIGSRPHISLALFESCVEEQVSELIEKYFTDFPNTSIAFPAFALIPGKLQTIFLVPAVNRKLLERQEKLFQLLIDHGHKPLARYQPEKWLPHCSISKELSASKALKTIEVCQKSRVPETAKVVEAGFIEFRPRKEIKHFSIS